MSRIYPADVPGVYDCGDGVFLLFDEDGRGFSWKHPACRAWARLRFRPDPASTGHALVDGGKEHPERLTVAGSLLCPMGCGCHGFIEGGRWRRA